MQNAADFHKKLVSLGVEIVAESGRLRLSAPSGTLSEKIQTVPASQMTALLELLDDRSLLRSGLGDLPDGRIALSWGQRRLWLLDQIDGPNAAFNIPLALRLRGPLDTEALAAAVAELVTRHAPLRTIVETVGDVPFGRLLPPPAPQTLLAREDLSGLPAEEWGGELSARYVSEAARPFDLDSEFLLRGRIIHLGDEDHILILVVHHAAADGVSLSVLLGELASAYGALRNGAPPDLPALPIQYADYAAWQQSWLEQGEEFAGQIGYWRKQLAGAPHLLTLPTDRPRDPDRSRKAAYLPLRLEPDLARQIEVLARRHGVTPFAVVLAGYGATLGRLAGQEDVVIGAPIAGRNRIETENLIGFFVNMLPLRLDLAGNPDTATLIARARHTALDGFGNQDLPFERLIQELALPRSRTHAPLFQVAFVWQSQGSPSFTIPGLATETIFLSLPQAKYDLTLGLIPQPDGSFVGNIEYDVSLFDEATIVRWRAYLVRTLEGMTASATSDTRLSTRPVTALPILDAVERKLVLETFNDTAAPLPDTNLAALFEAQVTLTPSAIALVGEDRQLTYAELDSDANRLAHRLIVQRIGPESVVGIALDRSNEMVVALLAILKAGAAYLPLDPEYPTQRIQFMLRDSHAKLLLTTSKIATHLKLSGEESKDTNVVPLLFIDDISVKADLAIRPSTAPTNADRTTQLSPANLAYVIYTSGSTGQPKGVATTHSNVVALAWRPKYAPLGPGQTVLQLAPVSFDAATFELWGALLNGARLVLAPPGSLDLDRIAHTISRHEIDTLWLTAGLFRQVVETHPHLLAGVKQLLAGGDVLPIATVKRVRELYPALTLINGYGPTETTTFACTRLIISEDLEAERIPIGSPISNTRVYVLDGHLSPVPIGVTGELYISGAGLAWGYLNRPDLTAERFVPCPFGSPGERMYRTGDLARWLPDGAIDFVGRADSQVKIRGFRIEPGEIESTIAGISGIAQAVVIPREISGDTRLVAYLVARHGATIPAAGKLRAALAARLPDYMIPAAFVSIDALPLTVNGKLDRELLPMPKRMGPEAVSPLTKTERRLAKIWKGILGLDEVDRTEDFFELGGHSLLALRLIAAVEAEFGRRIDLATLFEAPTIESFALAVERWDERQFDFRKVVRLYPESTRPQIFGINNTGAYYHLAKKLGPKWPLTALQLFDPSIPPDRMPESIEEISAQYVQLIRRLQPHGPYSLLSWCAGGILTIEVAHQLLAANEEVSFLALIESYAPVHYKRFSWLRSRLAANSFRPQWILAEFKKVLAGELSLTKFLTDRQSVQIVARVIKAFRGPRPESAAAEYELWLMVEYLASAAKRYQLKAFPGRIHLFRASMMPKGVFLDDLNGWGAYAAGGVELAFIEGDHHSIFRPPGVDQMAEKIAAAVTKAIEFAVKSPSPENSSSILEGLQ